MSIRKSARERGYNTAWEKARIAYLMQHPFCVMHLQMGQHVQATVVDHIIPHKGDYALMWDVDGNWQALCKACHDRHKKSQEMGGKPRGAALDGQPLDPGHHWNQK